MPLDPQLRDDLLATYQALKEQGEIVPVAKLEQYYQTFRSRFGPDVLANLDGELLLNTLHGSSDPDSMVYWLEWKNDEVFPTGIFGSIAGGSALKFGIYRRKETGNWMTGSPQHQQELSIPQAVEIIRRYRDQLLAGVRLLEALPPGADDQAYAELQAQMDRVAPEVSNTVWGHKYFHLLCPDKLDDYNVDYLQRFHLIKMLQLPPEGEGRYRCAGRYIQIAHELEMPINHLSRTLNHRNSGAHTYWKVRVNPTGDSEQGTNEWEAMRNGGYVGMWWVNLGNLSHIKLDSDSKKLVAELMHQHYNARSWANEVFNFVVKMREGDLVCAFEANTVLGMGRITGEYQYAPTDSQAPHRHAVEWLSEEVWPLPMPEAVGRVVRELKEPANLLEIERRLLGAAPLPIIPRPVTTVPDELHDTPIYPIPKLAGIAGRIQSVLTRKKQVVLYGPPGTGKTYWARRAVQDLAAYQIFGRAYLDLPGDQQQELWQKSGPIRMCTFHPAYGYEDFLEGYRPVAEQGQLIFERRSGIFKRLCEEAARQPERNFYLIIDEINRGDIPRIFGELLTLLEKDKRGDSLLLPLSGERFCVPPNVYLIGTMNTADRSIALLDTALRRRFGFVELMPDSSLLQEGMVGGQIPLAAWLDGLNQQILTHVGRDARNLQIGHAYFLDGGQPVTEMNRFVRIVADDILPLLEEYCYEDFTLLAEILGDSLIDREQQRIRHELFDPARRDLLVQALLSPFPNITASASAVRSEAEQAELTQTLEDDPEDVAGDFSQ